DVVFERRVRNLETVVELEAAPEIVVLARGVGRAQSRIDDASDCPRRAGLALDPHQHLLRAACVVPAAHEAFGEASGLRGGLHGADYTIAPDGPARLDPQRILVPLRAQPERGGRRAVRDP